MGNKGEGEERYVIDYAFIDQVERRARQMQAEAVRAAVARLFSAIRALFHVPRIPGGGKRVMHH